MVQAGQHDPLRVRALRLTSCGVMVGILAVLSLVVVPLPFSPVPVTLQTLGVFLAGGLLGPRWGTFAVAVYVLMGSAGVPVFAGGEAGIGIILGPKGGYLLAFVPCAFVVGFLAQRSIAMRQPGRTLLVVAGMLLGTATIYLCGVAWLCLVTGMKVGLALVVGVLPFIPGDILKIVAAAVLLRSLWRALPVLERPGLFMSRSSSLRLSRDA